MIRRFSILATFMWFFCCNLFAKGYFQSIIENYDVDEKTLALRSSNPAEFWNSLVRNSMNVQDLLTNIQKKGGAEKETLRLISNFPKYDKEFRPDAIDELQPLCDSLFSKVGFIKGVDRCIVADETVNAFTAQSSDGMVVGLNIGILNAKGINEPILVGIMAHEYAHACLLHQLRQVYDNIKRRKKNDILKGITVAVSAVGEVASAYSDAMLGNEHSSANFENQIYQIEKSYHKDLHQYYFNYSRELELEADLIAYRFLEWSGYGGDNYIKLLQLLGANNPNNYIEDENSDHPTINDRIAFINYVKNHKELSNTRNGKLKKKHAIRADKYSDPLYY